MSRTTLVLDSTQISTFLECPAKWQFAHKENLVLSNETREDFAMGTYGHKLLEIFYLQKKNGASLDKSVAAALEFDFDSQQCQCGHAKEYHRLYYGQSFENTRLRCIDEKCSCGKDSPDSEGFRPILFPLKEETRQSVRQRFNEYWMVYSQKDIQPTIVEEGFSYELLSNTHCLYVLEGKVDILGLFDGIPCFLDHKFQGRRHELYNKSIQFRNYALATNSRLGIINYIRLAKETTNKTFERKVTSFSAYELEMWRVKLIEIFDQVAYKISCANAFTNGQLEQNFGSCSGRYGFPCHFTPLCEEYNKDVKENIKKSLFKIGKEWKPW